MERIESAERRFSEAIERIEAELDRAAETRRQAQRGLELAETIEKRCEKAIKQLRDLIRHGEAEAGGEADG